MVKYKQSIINTYVIISMIMPYRMLSCYKWCKCPYTIIIIITHVSSVHQVLPQWLSATITGKLAEHHLQSFCMNPHEGSLWGSLAECNGHQSVSLDEAEAVHEKQSRVER